MSNISYPKYKLPENLSVTSVTASNGFSGMLYDTASYALDADKLDGVDSALYALKTDVTGALSPYLTSATAASTYATLTGVSGSFARLASANTFTNTNTFTQITASMHVSSSQFYGNGSTLTNLTASNIDNFTSDVRKQLSAGSGLNYDAANGVFSLGSGTGTETSTATTTGLTASNQFFIACSGSVTGSVVNVQLPLISTVGDGKNYVIKNIGVGIVNVIASGSNRVDGALSGTLYTTYSSYSLFGTGSNWWIY